MTFPFQMEVGLGVSSYHGDVCTGCITPNAAFNLGLKYYLNNQVTFIPRLGYTRFSGDDQQGKNQLRNLSFRSDAYFASVNIAYNFNKYYYGSPRKFWPYGIIGVGALAFNPKAELNNEYVALQPLQTEGVAYSRITMFIPLGVGFRYKVQEGVEIGLEYSFNYTFSDYIDDVSTDYVDIYSLYGDAQLLADRTYELDEPPTQTTDGTYWAEGAKRGESKAKDLYSLLMISVKFDIYKASAACPH